MGVRIGVSDLHYAILTKDDPKDAIEWGTPVRIVNLIEVEMNENVSANTLFADDGAAITATTTGELEVTLNVAEIDVATEAALLGKTVDSKGVLLSSTGDQAPWVAIGFKSLMENSKYEYVWLYKGKFARSSQTYTTKGDAVEFQTDTITGKFVYPDTLVNNKKSWKANVKDGATGVDSDTITNWFTKVYQSS